MQTSGEGKDRRDEKDIDIQSISPVRVEEDGEGGLGHVIDCHYCSSMDQISIDISKAAVSEEQDSRKSPGDREVRNLIINNGKGGK